MGVFGGNDYKTGSSPARADYLYTNNKKTNF